MMRITVEEAPPFLILSINFLKRHAEILLRLQHPITKALLRDREVDRVVDKVAEVVVEAGVVDKVLVEEVLVVVEIVC
jgi:hypothetical protein